MNNFEDERGFIKVYNPEGKLLGYISSIDYSNMTYVVRENLDYAKRYIQEDLIMHDMIWLQGYCCANGDVFSPKLPFSSFGGYGD